MVVCGCKSHILVTSGRRALSEQQLRAESERPPNDVHARLVTWRVDGSPLESFQLQDDVAKILDMSNTTSRVRPISGTEPTDDRGSPASCPADQLRLHLVMRQAQGRPVIRSPQNLRLHRALVELDFIDLVEELNEAARSKDESSAEPVFITTSGTILAGFGRWRLAVFEGRHEVHCIEYPISEQESLQFILGHHKPQRGWNAFVRIRLALTLESDLQQRALDNMRAGGRYKGWASLPKAEQMNVRRRIADIAGVGTRNVSNVKAILKNVHPRLIAALLNGSLTIHGAMQFCKLPKTEQLEQFIRQSEDRETSKVIRRSVARPKEEKSSVDLATVLDALQQQEARHPGSVVVEVGRLPRTVILVGQDLLTGPHSQKELEPHEIPRSSQANSVSDAPTLGPG